MTQLISEPDEGVIPEANTAAPGLDPGIEIPDGTDAGADTLADEDASDADIEPGDEADLDELPELEEPGEVTGDLGVAAKIAGVISGTVSLLARHSNGPVSTLAVSKMPGGVGYLQAVVHVAGVKNSKGSWAPLYVLAQAVNHDRDTRFILFRADGSYAGSWMVVRGGGHGASFHAYRSAAGNLYVWTWIKGVAHRIRWQGGKTVKTGLRTDYKKRRPVGSYGRWIGMRRGYSSHEVISLHDRHDLAAGKTAPKGEVKLAKRRGFQLQSWGVTERHIYRVSGKTNFPAGKVGKQLLEIFNWAGKLVYAKWIGPMHVKATSDEPQGVTFRIPAPTAADKRPQVLVGKRSGGSKPNRSYPIWAMSDMP